MKNNPLLVLIAMLAISLILVSGDVYAECIGPSDYECRDFFDPYDCEKCGCVWGMGTCIGVPNCVGLGEIECITCGCRWLEDYAQYVSGSYDGPTEMRTGEVKDNVHITMKNTGITTWTVGNYYFCPTGNKEFGDSCKGVGTDVSPGQQKEFTISMTAPSATGDKTLEWQMRKGSSNWFGEKFRKTITVSEDGEWVCSDINGNSCTVFKGKKCRSDINSSAYQKCGCYDSSGDEITLPSDPKPDCKSETASGCRSREGRLCWGSQNYVFNGISSCSCPKCVEFHGNCGWPCKDCDGDCGGHIIPGIPCTSDAQCEPYGQKCELCCPDGVNKLTGCGRCNGLAIPECRPCGTYCGSYSSKNFLCDIPNVMCVNATRTFGVGMRNTGTSIWTPANYKLGAIDNSDPFCSIRQSLTSDVSFCQDHTFSFDCKAGEEDLGNRTSDWRMVRDGNWFGETCKKTVQVKVCESPVAKAGPDQTVNFTAPYTTVYFSDYGSYDPDGGIVSYEWDFDSSNGIQADATGTYVSHNYYEEGVYEVTLTVTDNDGVKDSDTLIARVSETPTITDDYAYDGVWVKSDQTVTLNPQDSSGIKTVKYCYGSKCDPEKGTVLGSPYKINFNGSQNKWVRYQAWDIHDNPSGIGQFRVMIDKTAPRTEDNSDNETHGDNYVVTLTCNDEYSGCDKTYYCVSANGSSTCIPETLGTPPKTNVVVNCEAFSYCEKVIRYYSIDKIGNKESIETSGVIRIDTRIPRCEMVGLDTYTTSVGIRLEWSGYDPAGGGITGYRVWYRRDSGSWDIWDVFSGSVQSETFTGEDEHSYDFRCQSVTGIYPAGGSHSSIVSTFVDVTPPAASLESLPAWINQASFLVSWSGDDSGSGVKDYDVRYSTSLPSWLDWLADTELTSKEFGKGDPINIKDNETYHFRVRARDKAGLQGKWSGSESIGVDLTAPICEINDLPGYVTTSEFLVSWSGNDSGSGVKNYDVEYSLNERDWFVFANHTADKSKTASLDDGNYSLHCRARDSANNVGEWSKSKIVVVDTRAPIGGVDYKSPVIGGKNITVNATFYDISNITNVTLTYGDSVITEAARVETYANHWDVLWTFPVPADYGSDEFIVITEDMHGNSESFRYSFDIVLCEGDETRECGTDVGECEKGNQTCIDGKWGECLGGLDETLEVCDGLDNDCDGEIDEGIICSCAPGGTQECGTDTGECSKGIQTCTTEQVWGECGNGYVGPQPEICDGLDNNCDGRIDDGARCCQEGKTRPCGHSNIGICRFGESLCMNGVWGDCIGAVRPINETCGNGEDDDCDDEIDEDCDLCYNGVQDEEEEGIDCGGPCPACLEFPWFILSIIGIIILVVLFVLWWRFKSKGEELTWDGLKRKWSGGI